jgi:hypothetical protein
MGREIKKVAVAFEWPMSKVWHGFINPHYEGHCRKCQACNGSGLSAEAVALKDQWYGNAPFHPSWTGCNPFSTDHPYVAALALRNVGDTSGFMKDVVLRMEALRLANLFNSRWSHCLDADDVAALLAADRLWDFTRTPRTPEQKAIVEAKVASGGNSWLPESNGYGPSPREVNDWSVRHFGHDAINCYIAVSAKCKRLGFEAQCGLCHGEGDDWDSVDNKRIAEEWQQVEPPPGDGWQVWETVSEGSPVTPVFITADALIDYLVSHGDAWDQKRGEGGWTREQAAAFVNDAQWVPSGMVRDGQYLTSREVAAYDAARGKQ